MFLFNIPNIPEKSASVNYPITYVFKDWCHVLGMLML